MRKLVVFVVGMLVTVGIDQGSKAWAHTLPVAPPGCTDGQLAAHRCAGVPVPVIDGAWDWELAMNSGAAFSFADEAGAGILLSLIAVAALVGIGIAASRTRPEQGLRRIAYAMIAGGALGNLIDRVRVGAVTDFVHWHGWPVFNIADAALLVGVAVYVLDRAKNFTGRTAGA